MYISSYHLNPPLKSLLSGILYGFPQLTFGHRLIHLNSGARVILCEGWKLMIYITLGVWRAEKRSEFYCSWAWLAAASSFGFNGFSTVVLCCGFSDTAFTKKDSHCCHFPPRIPVRHYYIEWHAICVVDFRFSANAYESRRLAQGLFIIGDFGLKWLATLGAVMNLMPFALAPQKKNRTAL